MTTIQISVSARHVEAAMLAASKDESRYYLRGVYLDPRGFISATNGHVAFAALCEDARYAPDGGIIVPLTALAQAVKAAGRARGPAMAFECDAQAQWWLLYGAARIAFDPIDGTFPDWRRVIPEAPGTLTAAHYDPAYVAALGKMAQALDGGKRDASVCFRLHQNGLNPALVTFIDSDKPRAPVRTNCVAVIMPVRSEPSEYAATGHVSAFRP